MVGKLLPFLGDTNDKQIKRLRPLADQVSALEPTLETLSDEELLAKTADFRQRVEDGETIDDLLMEVFACVREASRRIIGLRHFDVQLIGGMVLHQGKIAEMKTGEGKTLMATLPLYLNALEGKGTHLITVNEYLARRDATWMGPVYHALGLTVGCLQHEQSYIYDASIEEGDSRHAHLRPVTRRDAYAADITYGTNNEFGFDYLRDNMVANPVQKVQRGLHYAIVDEVDNILIDEARTPLIISGPSQDSTKLYATFSQLIPRLTPDTDYKIEEKERAAVLGESGIGKLEEWLNIENLYDPANSVLSHFVENALRAHAIYQRDKDYVVNEGEVIIVDEFTGRLMPGRRYGDGLHQAIEAKEHVEVRGETITYATVTLQNYFRMYSKLAGMTGTAVTEAEEFSKVYKLEVVVIPTHRPMVREDLPDLIFKTEDAKCQAVADEIADLHTHGRPVLVGTVSIERSEQLGAMLVRRGVPHDVLNAKQHEREATIVAQAGRPGAVTVATNMAGRGTDIVLGGDVGMAESPEAWQRDHDAVVNLGGLAIVGTERHESRRIDNQLRGRAGRQGDPGTTRFYGSFEDEIMRRFGGDRMKTIMNWAGVPDDVPLESRMVTGRVNGVQVRAEAHNFDIRKHLLEYDDVMNLHRDTIYGQRNEILSGADMKEQVQGMIADEVASLMNANLQGEPNDWGMDILLMDLATIFPLPQHLNEDALLEVSAQEVEEQVLEAALELYERREAEFTPDTMRAIERTVMLQVVDRLWVQHLTAMQNLRQGIGLYAYGQRDPLVMYKKEAHEQFGRLREQIRHDIVHTIYYVAPVGHKPQSNGGGTAASERRTTAVDPSKLATVTSKAVAPRSVEPVGARKVGRNDPCPCGSGKKYKRCHGAAG
jgi:preprotein translocase subunit SecA